MKDKYVMIIAILIDLILIVSFMFLFTLFSRSVLEQMTYPDSEMDRTFTIYKTLTPFSYVFLALLSIYFPIIMITGRTPGMNLTGLAYFDNKNEERTRTWKVQGYTISTFILVLIIVHGSQSQNFHHGYGLGSALDLTCFLGAPMAIASLATLMLLNSNHHIGRIDEEKKLHTNIRNKVSFIIALVISIILLGLFLHYYPQYSYPLSEDAKDSLKWNLWIEDHPQSIDMWDPGTLNVTVVNQYDDLVKGATVYVHGAGIESVKMVDNGNGTYSLKLKGIGLYVPDDSAKIMVWAEKTGCNDSQSLYIDVVKDRG